MVCLWLYFGARVCAGFPFTAARNASKNQSDFPLFGFAGKFLHMG